MLCQRGLRGLQRLSKLPSVGGFNGNVCVSERRLGSPGPRSQQLQPLQGPHAASQPSPRVLVQCRGDASLLASCEHSPVTGACSLPRGPSSQARHLARDRLPPTGREARSVEPSDVHTGFKSISPPSQVTRRSCATDVWGDPSLGGCPVC